MNEKQMKAMARYTATVLGNFAVIGFGLALYQQEWPCMILALISAKLGAIILWRSERDG